MHKKKIKMIIEKKGYFMPKNMRETYKKIATEASKILANPNSTKAEIFVAKSALAQIKSEKGEFSVSAKSTSQVKSTKKK